MAQVSRDLEAVVALLKARATRHGRSLQTAIRKILDHLGLSTPEAEKPPPLREVLRVAEHGEGWGVPGHWE